MMFLVLKSTHPTIFLTVAYLSYGPKAINNSVIFFFEFVQKNDDTWITLQRLCRPDDLIDKYVFPFQFRTCMLAMLGMGGGEEESSTTQSVTEVSKVGPA